MRVLVTGGAGFIGSNLVNAVIAAGHEAGIIDDLSTGRADFVHPAAFFRRLDILDPAMPETVAGFAPDAVVHLAAQPDVQESLRDPARTLAVNVDGTRRVARAARETGARVMVSASSAAVYGDPETLPLPESARKAPANPYGDSKLEAESALAEALAGSPTDFASFRFSNVYGPRQDWRGEGGVVAIFAGRMVAGEVPVVYGTGEQTRDFIYVGDIVGAIMEALLADATLAGDGVDGPAYNISTGRELSVEELVGRMRAAARYTGPVEHEPAREGDIDRSTLDPGKARAVFGWHAGVDLDAGLRSTLRWFQSEA